MLSIIKPDAGQSMEQSLFYTLPTLNASLYLAATWAGHICLNPDGGYKEYGKNN